MQCVDAFYEQFGTRIRRARVHADISQEELGHRVGLNRSSVSNVEKGRQRVPAHMVVEFATALGIPPCELLPTSPLESDPLRGVPQETRSFVEEILNSAGENPRG
jgi:transcriptional regulator with XRE-family HTH domain